MATKTLHRPKDGSPTGKNCPNCGRPTLWDEILQPCVTDIPDALPTGEYTEICSDCTWNSADEQEYSESVLTPIIQQFEGPYDQLFERHEYPGMVEWWRLEYQVSPDGNGYAKDWGPIERRQLPNTLKAVPA